MSIEDRRSMPNIDHKTVFIADVSSEMQGYRKNLIKELEHHGCIIKEANIIDGNSEHVRGILEQCDAALHILSDKDFEYESSGRGLEELQINYSVQHFLSLKLISGSSQNGFQIYAWHLKSSAETIFSEGNTSKHLKKIQQLEEVDLIRTNFEDFKYYLLKRIDNHSIEKDDEFYIKGNDNQCIYFLFDAVDSDKAKDYTDYLSKMGYNILTPIFQSDIIKVRQTHINNLKKFDIAIIFAIKGSVNWVNMKIMDILKSPGLGRDKSIRGKAVFLPQKYGSSLPLARRGFNNVATDSGSPKDQIEEFLKDLA